MPSRSRTRSVLRLFESGQPLANQNSNTLPQTAKSRYSGKIEKSRRTLKLQKTHHTFSPVIATLFAAITLFFVVGDSVTVTTASETSVSALVVVQDNPVPTSEESITAGRTIYGRFCRSCHGQRADGRGMAAPPGSRPANLIDDQWDHGDSDGEIFTVIREGVPPKYDMDAWEGRITDDDIWDVVNFLRDLGSSE